MPCEGSCTRDRPIAAGVLGPRWSDPYCRSLVSSGGSNECFLEGFSWGEVAEGGSGAFIEAYAQATRRAAKPLVRGHLRMAVNKPH